jgi:hypothetical protein
MLPLPHHQSVDQHDVGPPGHEHRLPAASTSPAPSSAGPIANKSNARRPAPPMKAVLGKSFIAIGRSIAPPQNKSACRMGKVS